MSSRYSQIRIAMGPFEGSQFAPAGQDGDRFDRFISFEGDLPVPIPNFTAPPRVIITPVRKLLKFGTSFNIMTPTCVARDVTEKGFRLAAYNADPDFGGFSEFNWVAIEEAPDATSPVPDLQTGVLPPDDFGPFRVSIFAQRTFRDHAFGGFGLFDSSVAAVQLTATDCNVHGHSVPAVGIVDNARVEEPIPHDSKDMTSHNVDIAAGGCAFNWAKFSYSENFDRASNAGLEPIIETGEVAETWFEPGGRSGDWRIWDIIFKGPFAQPPVVLLTAVKPVDIPVRLNAAVVGVVQAATNSGFRLAARSCDLRPGLAGFHWIALGRPA